MPNLPTTTVRNLGPPDDLCPNLRAALESQDSIGWGTVVEGLISSQRRQLIMDHFSAIGSSHSADQWASSFASRCPFILRLLWKAHNKAVQKNTSALDPRDDPTQNGINEAIVEHHNRGLELLLPKFGYMFLIDLH